MRSILLTALSFALTAAQAPADSTIFVALSKGPSSISQVSVATGKIITSIPTGPGGATMAVTPNGQQAYVLSPELLELNSTGNNTIAVVNLQTGKIAATLSLTATPSLIAFDPAGEHAYVVATDAENRNHRR
jgi:DNA-binding beta-propeller fold protein YncE